MSFSNVRRTFKLCYSLSLSLSSLPLNPLFLPKTHFSISSFSSSSGKTLNFLIQFSPFPSNCTLSVINSHEKRRIFVGLAQMIKVGEIFVLHYFSHNFCPFSLVKIMSFFRNRQTAFAFFKFCFGDDSEETVRACCVAAHLLAQKGLRYFSQDLLSWVVSRIGFSRSDEVAEFMWREHRRYESDFSVLDSLMRAFSRAEMVPKVIDTVYRMRENGLRPGLSAVNILLELLLRVGDFVSVWKLFRDMVRLGPRPSTTTFNVMILGFVLKGHLCIGESLLHIMRKFQCEPDVYTYNILINAYCSRGRISDGLGLLHFMIEMGCSPNIVTFSPIINAMCKEGNVTQAKKVLDQIEEMGIVPNTTIYNTLIDGYVKGMQIVEANALYEEMRKKSVSPDVVTFNILVNAHYKYLGAYIGDEFLKELSSSDSIPDCWLDDINVSGLCYTGQLDEAMGRLENMLEKGLFPSVFAFNSIIAAYSSAGIERKAFKLYELMVKFGYSPSSSTCSSLLMVLSGNGRLHEARELLNTMREKGFPINKVAFTVLLDGYFRAGDKIEAQTLWDEMESSGFSPDVVAFSAYINGLSILGQFDEAYRVLLKMLEKGLKPNNFAYNSLMGYYCNHGRVDEAQELIKEMKKRGLAPDLFTSNIIINGFCKENRMRSAIDIFEGMRHLKLAPDIVTYNTLISGFCKVFDKKNADDFLKRICKNGWFPDITTHNIYMQEFCTSHRMPLAVIMLDHLVSVGIVPNTVTYNTLLNGICDEILHRAVILTAKLLKMAFVPNIVTANLLLSHLCKQGLFERALEWSDKMREISFQFDEITYKILDRAEYHNTVGGENYRESTEKELFIDFLMKTTYEYFCTYVTPNLRRPYFDDFEKVIKFLDEPEDLTVKSSTYTNCYQRHNRKTEQGAEEADSLKESLDKYYLRNQRRTQETRERAELIGRASGESSHILRIFDEESQAMQSACNSSRILEESYATGVAILTQFAGQKERLKRAQRKALDVLDTIGLSNSLLKLIERCSRVDQWINYVGMYLTIVILVAFWRWTR